MLEHNFIKLPTGGENSACDLLTMLIKEQRQITSIMTSAIYQEQHKLQIKRHAFFGRLIMLQIPVILVNHVA